MPIAFRSAVDLQQSLCLRRAAAGEGQECVGAVRGLVVARADPSTRRAVRPIPCDRRAAASARRCSPASSNWQRGKIARGGADRLHLVDGTFDDVRAYALLCRDLQCAALQPQAFPVAVMRPVVLAECHIALGCPVLQPAHIVADELAGVLVIADEAVKAGDVLVQPDCVEIVSCQDPRSY